MEFYAKMLAQLERREMALTQELEQLRSLRNSIAPLAKAQPVASEVEYEPIQNLADVRPNPGIARGTGTVRFEILSPPPKTISDAARQALMRARGPMHIRGLIDAVLQSPVGEGRTARQIRQTLAPTLLRRTNVFKSLGNGMYALVAEDKRTVA